jgi:hypothetical protein
MEWPVVDQAPLSTAPLIVDQGLFTIEANDVEHRNGRYILQQDEAMSLACNSSELTVREIRPSAGTEYHRDEQGCVVFEGTALTGRGDRYGALDVGIFVPNLDYPIAVLQFELTAPLSVSGDVQLRGDEFRIHRFRRSNAPPAESNHYPYRFDYNITTDDGEIDWHEMPLVIACPDDFLETPSLELAPDEMTTAFDQGSPVRIRLRSARGEICAFKAICNRREIIRFPEPQPPVPIIDWIGRPNTLNIVHERYRFDIDNMVESWQEYPQLMFDSATEWLEFQAIQFSVTADMLLLEGGDFLRINLNFDLKECPDLMSIPTDFLQYLDPSIDDEHFKFLDLNDLDINRDSLEISFSVRYPLPARSVEFKPRSTRLTSYYGVLNEGQNFYSNMPFSNKKWYLPFAVSHKHVPWSSATFRILCEWSGPAVAKNGQNLESRFHPRHAQLYRCVFERMQPNAGVFCPECETIGFPAPNGVFSCTNYKCKWTNSTPMLTDFDEVSEPWYEYQGEPSPGLHSYSLNKEHLTTGKYVVAFNGMSFHFEVE